MAEWCLYLLDDLDHHQATRNYPLNPGTQSLSNNTELFMVEWNLHTR